MTRQPEGVEPGGRRSTQVALREHAALAWCHARCSLLRARRCFRATRAPWSNYQSGLERSRRVSGRQGDLLANNWPLPLPSALTWNATAEAAPFRRRRRFFPLAVPIFQEKVGTQRLCRTLPARNLRALVRRCITPEVPEAGVSMEFSKVAGKQPEIPGLDEALRNMSETLPQDLIAMEEVSPSTPAGCPTPSPSFGHNVKLSFASIGLTAMDSKAAFTNRHHVFTPLLQNLPTLAEVTLVASSFQLPRLPYFVLPFFDKAPAAEALSALNHVYAGTVARTMSQVVCHPVDTVKTRMQIKDPPKKLRKWRRKITKKGIEIGPIGIDNWFFKGPGDLFRGVWGAILGTIPNAMLYFVAYESTKKKLENHLPPGVVHVASASVGTAAASVVRVPADTIKHRVQAYLHRNVFEAFWAIIQTEGIGGLYRGFWPTLMRDIPEIAIQFAAYEKLRAFVKEKRKVDKLTTPEHLVLGAAAGALAATCTMPLDLVKTRQQCGVAEGIHRIVMNVVAESGPAGLLSGLGPRALQVSMMSAVFFGLFEYCKLVIKPDRSPTDKLYLPKIWNKRRDHIWKRQFVYTE